MRKAILMKLFQFTTIFLVCMTGIIPITCFAQPYVISSNGLEVTDQKTGLIWSRCVIGMNWDGGLNTCVNATTSCVHANTNIVAIFTHEEALKCASQVGSVTPWRLPNIKELASISERSISLAFNEVAFPATPTNFGYWSSTPNVGVSATAWIMNFDRGQGGVSSRSNSLYVRLVRSGQ